MGHPGATPAFISPPSRRRRWWSPSKRRQQTSLRTRRRGRRDGESPRRRRRDDAAGSVSWRRVCAFVLYTPPQAGIKDKRDPIQARKMIPPSRIWSATRRGIPKSARFRLLSMNCRLSSTLPRLPILLVNVVSECGGTIMMSPRMRNATSRTDLTMMVLTRGYVDSNWCDDEMHARARSACTECPSHRLFPLRWRNYPWAANLVVPDRRLGCGFLQAIMTDQLLAAVEGAWGNPKTRPDEWRHAIDTTVAALGRFIGEVEATCTSPRCRQRVPATTPLPSRLG